MYLTLKNTDISWEKLAKPIVINFWLEPVDPLLKAEEYSNDPIAPQFALDDSGTLKSVKTKVEEDTSNPLSGWLWTGFSLALVVTIVAGIVYYYMRQRIKKLQLQQAVAEGKVSLREKDDEGTDNEGAPDKQGGVEMGRMSNMSTPQTNRHNESHRGMLERSDISSRFGTAHANETAMEYF